MNDLQQALDDLTTIRRQLAQQTQFRGYGPLTLGATSAVAIVAALLQGHALSTPMLSPYPYLFLWVSSAVISSSLIAIEMFARSSRLHDGLADNMLRTAIGHFLPALLAGALLTLTVVLFVPQTLWILPGLWQILSALGIAASAPFLPRLVLLASAWYLLSGLICIALGPAYALQPAIMGIPHAVGQFLMATVFLVTKFRSHYAR